MYTSRTLLMELLLTRNSERLRVAASLDDLKLLQMARARFPNGKFYKLIQNGKKPIEVNYISGLRNEYFFR